MGPGIGWRMFGDNEQMPIGKATQTATYAKPPREAFEDVEAVICQMGSVSKTDPGVVRGTSKYGLQTVDIRVRVIRENDGSKLEIAARSDDLWAGGARAVIAAFLKSLSGMGRTDFVADTRPINPIDIVRYAGVIAVLVVVLRYLLRNWVVLPGPVQGTLLTLGAIVAGCGLFVLAYFPISRWRFRNEK